MERTTIMISENLKARASKLAHDNGISFAELVRISLEDKLSSVETGIKDQFLNDNNYYEGAAPINTSIDHDKYLYE